MRILFVTSPGAGHIFPSVPLAQAVRAAGHEVLFAIGGDAVAAAEAGMPAVDTAPGVDYEKVYVPEGTEDVDPMRFDGGIEFVAQLFARVSGVTVDGVLEVARFWRPDLIVHSSLDGAGPLAASALGLPSAELVLGPADDEPELGELLRREMAEHYRRHSVTGHPSANVRLNSMPQSLAALTAEDGRPADDWPIRYVPYNGGGVLPDWLLRPAERPRIAVTLGSIEAQWGGITVLAPLFAAAGSVDAEFVLTLGGGDVSLLGDLPPNVRTIEWLPLAPLLETCAGIVHHGGSGTMMTAMAAGVPQCLIPQGPDQGVNRDAAVKLGVGISADAAVLGAEQCHALLDDDKLRAAARQVRDEMAAMPAPSELVPRLAALAAGGPVSSKR